VLKRKENKEDTLLCTGVNRVLLTSVLTLQVFYLHLFLWWLWFALLFDLLATPLFSIIELFRTRSAYVNCFRTQSHWLAEYLLLYSRVVYCYYKH
jgi:hypothetical protein